MEETASYHHEHLPAAMKAVLLPRLRLPHPITERYEFAFLALEQLFVQEGEDELFQRFVAAYAGVLGAPQPSRMYDYEESLGWLHGDTNQQLTYVGTITTLRVPALYSQCITRSALDRTELPALFLRRLAALLGRTSGSLNIAVFLDFFRRFPATKRRVTSVVEQYREIVDVALAFRANGLGSFHTQGDHVLFFQGTLDLALLEKNMGGMGFAYKVGRCGGYLNGRNRASLTVVGENGALLERGFAEYGDLCERVRLHHFKARLRALLA